VVYIVMASLRVDSESLLGQWRLIFGDAALVSKAVTSPMSAPSATSVPFGPATRIENVIEASDVLNIIVVQKKVEEVPLSKCMKNLVGGSRLFRSRSWAIFKWNSGQPRRGTAV
jgi:hypothetical protein